MGSIARVAAAHGQCMALGTHPTVGFGLLLQGGVGHLTRKFGLAVKHILELEIVTAKGIMHPHRTDEDGLFQALCGAAPNLGVVTAVTLRCFPDPGPFLCTQQIYTSSQAVGQASRLSQLTQGASSLPHGASIDALLYHARPGELCLGVSTFPLQTDAGAVQATETVLDSLPGPSAHTKVDSLQWVDLFENEFLSSSHVRFDRMDPSPLASVKDPREVNAFVLAIFMHTFPPAAAEWCCQRMQIAPSPLSTVQLQHGGGLAKVPMTSESWEWSCVVSGIDFLDPESPDSHLAHLQSEGWVRGTISGLQRLGVGQAVYAVDILYHDVETAKYVFAPETMAKLAALKRDLDPLNTLAFACPVAPPVASRL